MSFAMYLLGTVLVVGGLIYVCHLAHLPQTWTLALGVMAAGVGIMGAVRSTRQKDPN